MEDPVRVTNFTSDAGRFLYAGGYRLTYDRSTRHVVYVALVLCVVIIFFANRCDYM